MDTGKNLSLLSTMAQDQHRIEVWSSRTKLKNSKASLRQEKEKENYKTWSVLQIPMRK